MNTDEKPQHHFIKVAQIDDFSEENRLFLEINDIPIVIFRMEDQFFAIEDVCTHDNGPLGEGHLDGFCVVCPRHGARFDLRSGEAKSLPAVQNISAFPVRIIGSDVEIGIRY